MLSRILILCSQGVRCYGLPISIGFLVSFCIFWTTSLLQISVHSSLAHWDLSLPVIDHHNGLLEELCQLGPRPSCGTCPRAERRRRQTCPPLLPYRHRDPELRRQRPDRPAITRYVRSGLRGDPLADMVSGVELCAAPEDYGQVHCGVVLFV